MAKPAKPIKGIPIDTGVKYWYFLFNDNRRN
jgi:hypothetical protein